MMPLSALVIMMVLGIALIRPIPTVIDIPPRSPEEPGEEEQLTDVITDEEIEVEIDSWVITPRQVTQELAEGLVLVQSASFISVDGLLVIFPNQDCTSVIASNNCYNRWQAIPETRFKLENKRSRTAGYILAGYLKSPLPNA